VDWLQSKSLHDLIPTFEQHQLDGATLSMVLHTSADASMHHVPLSLVERVHLRMALLEFQAQHYYRSRSHSTPQLNLNVTALRWQWEKVSRQLSNC
jgi:hypothetical protein